MGEKHLPGGHRGGVSTIPGVKPGRVVAFGVPDEAEGTELIAVVVKWTRMTRKKAETAKQIRRAIAANLSDREFRGSSSVPAGS